jgi:hypothetical protein
MANGPTRSWTMCHLRKKKEALHIPLRPLPREASKGEARSNWEQALLWRQGSRTKGKGQKSRQEVSRSISDALGLLVDSRPSSFHRLLTLDAKARPRGAG